MTKRNQWRTFAGLLVLGLMMLAALWLCRDRANGPALLSSTITGLGGLGLWLAGKSAVEHATSKAPSP
jgi:lipopolysaccharide export LptBFGC system permease protein LptF